MYKCSELICVHGNSEACAYGCVRCVKTLWKQAERLIHTQNDGPLPLHSHTAPLTVHWALSRLSCHSVRTYSNMCVSRRVTTHAHAASSGYMHLRGMNVKTGAHCRMHESPTHVGARAVCGRVKRAERCACNMAGWLQAAYSCLSVQVWWGLG